MDIIVIKVKVYGGFVFYQFDDEALSVEADSLNENLSAAGYVSRNELNSIYKKFNLPYRAVEMCNERFGDLSSSIEMFEQCFFIKLAVLNDNAEQSGSLAIFALKNLILIVNISDTGFANRDLFMKMMSKASSGNASAERLLISFFEGLVVLDDKRLENIRQSIAELEESVINKTSDNGFNIKLLKIKRQILFYRGYYERLIDIAQVIVENDNELFGEEIKKISRFTDKVKRLKDSTDILTDSVVHLWDAYQASLNMKLNETMKFFTLVTTVFFPLTVIVGWYGMNFNSMPEFKWKYGYVYVIALSVAVIAVLIAWFKKKKWI